MTEQKGLIDITEIDNPFESTLFPNCLEREAGYNRGCYSGFEKARTVFKPNVAEAKREERERIQKELELAIKSNNLKVNDGILLWDIVQGQALKGGSK